MLEPRDMREELMKENPELVKQFEPLKLSEFLKKAGLMPPDYTMDYDEEDVFKMHNDAKKDPLEKIKDHRDDITHFEIGLVNKRNEGLLIQAVVSQGEVIFTELNNLESDAFQIINSSRVDRLRHNVQFENGVELPYKSSRFSHNYNWPFFSENLQASLMEYLYVSGVRPEIGLVVEYMTWNKELRLYIKWLHDLHHLLYR